MATYNDLPGFGDAITWPEYSGHPNDPRRPTMDDDYPVHELSDSVLAEFAIDFWLASDLSDDELLHQVQVIRKRMIDAALDRKAYMAEIAAEELR